jgi:DNA-binding beta-propeller fold protein YncE
MNHRFTALVPLLVVLVAQGGCGSDPSPTGGSTGTSSGTGGGPPDLDSYLSAPPSCAYDCPNSECAEVTTPYACPAAGAWDQVPHAESCPAWDGSYPAPVAGKCVASAPTEAALLRTGPAPGEPSAEILPDGRIMRPAGKTWHFDEAEMRGGAPSALTPVPGTSYVLTVDTGSVDHAVRAVDTSLIGAGNPVTSFLEFSPPSYLNGSIAFVPPNRAYVATGYGVIQALVFDPATGTLTRDDDASPKLPGDAGSAPLYMSSVAASPDGKRLVVTFVDEKLLYVYDIDPASAKYLQKLGEVGLGARESFAAHFDPHDPSGSRVYVSLWGDRKVVEVDVSDATAPKLARSFATDQNPQGITFFDERWMAVANDYGETLSLVDRVSGAVSAIPVDFEPGLKGLDLSGVVFDEQRATLYTLLAGVNAIGAHAVDLAKSPPSLTPLGRLPTGWWPSALTVEPDGALTVLNLRGHPIGALDKNAEGDASDGQNKMRGSIQRIAAPQMADLVQGEALVSEAANVGARPGYPAVTCPAGVMDFPVPPTNTEGPSPVIDHIFFIVRENKTFDALLGDLPTVEGSDQQTLKASTAEMDQIWTNFRGLGKAFTIADNFYNLSIKSVQGHQWTTYGRTTDFCERTWSADARQVPLCGVGTAGRPDGGSLFEWLQENEVVHHVFGEIVGTAAKAPSGYTPIDLNYPGGPFQNISYNDLPKACYLAGRMRIACDLGRFAYITFPNDHTAGLHPTIPTPETMCAINDEATGLFIDALSHSPLWASSLVVITEDDPQQGGDHIDYHRAPLVLVSPWIKRGYVSKTHIDVASLFKLFAHVLGIPYPNVIVAKAGMPLDMFTSTPDYSPYVYSTHKWPISCGDGASAAERELTGSWDLELADTQSGIDEQVVRWMKGKQLEALTPRMKEEIEDRRARKAAGIPPLDEDDD